MCSKRELQQLSRSKKHEAAAAVNMQKRASTAAASATSMSDLLNNRDVINVICGEDEAELIRVRKMLREEKQQHSKTRRAKGQLEEDCASKSKMVETQAMTIASLQSKIMQLENEKKRVRILTHTHSHTHTLTHSHTHTLTHSLCRLWKKLCNTINVTKRNEAGAIAMI